MYGNYKMNYGNIYNEMIVGEDKIGTKLILYLITSFGLFIEI